MSENDCPYLFYKKSMSCTACTGYVCRAYGREKKLSDTELCKGDYWDCQRYVDASNVEVVETVTLNEEGEETLTTEEVIVPVVKPLYVKSPCGCQEDILLSACPYQSTVIPEGKKSCTGIWCYAENRAVRVPKNCRNFAICTVYLMSKFKGVPFP